MPRAREDEPDECRRAADGLELQPPQFLHHLERRFGRRLRAQQSRAARRHHRRRPGAPDRQDRRGDAEDRRQRLRPAGTGEQRLRQRLGDLDPDRRAERGGCPRRDLRLRQSDRPGLRRLYRDRCHHHRPDLQDQRSQPRRQRHPRLQRLAGNSRAARQSQRHSRRSRRASSSPSWSTTSSRRAATERETMPIRATGRDLSTRPAPLPPCNWRNGSIAGNPDGYFAQNGIADSDVLLIGDLNSYAQEDPVDALRDAGYVDLIDSFIGQGDAFSYIFDGQQRSARPGTCQPVACQPGQRRHGMAHQFARSRACSATPANSRIRTSTTTTSSPPRTMTR